MGNGDVSVAVRTEEDGYMFLLGKNDFWRQPYLYKGKQLVLESPWEITVNGIRKESQAGTRIIVDTVVEIN